MRSRPTSRKLQLGYGVGIRSRWYPHDLCPHSDGMADCDTDFACLDHRAVHNIHESNADTEMTTNSAAHPEPLKRRSLWHPSSRPPGGRERYTS